MIAWKQLERGLLLEWGAYSAVAVGCAYLFTDGDPLGALFGVDSVRDNSTLQPITGLANYTTSCYMNALIQMLATMPEYLETLKQRSRPDTPLINTLLSILTKINSKCTAGSSINGAADLAKAIKSTSRSQKSGLSEWKFDREQQDCSEFWQRLTQLLEQEQREVESVSHFGNLNAPTKAPTPTWWPSMWPHRLTTIRKMKCTVCDFEKEDRLERHEVLSLIPQPRRGGMVDNRSDLELSLEEYFGKETVQVSCEGCARSSGDKANQGMTESMWSSPESLRTSTPIGEAQSHEKETFMARMPRYLCCQVNNQIWDMMTGSAFKSQRPWTYPSRLDLGKFGFGKTGPKFYDIEAVIIHIGGANFGHYFTWRRVGEIWYECNDRRVRMIPGNGTGAHTPYMLLYKRQD